MIRKATIEDFEQIRNIKYLVGLYREKLSDLPYRLKVQKEGFLLFPTIEVEDYKKDLEKLFLIYKRKDEIEGFIRIDTEQEMKTDDSVEWYKAEMKEIYFSKPHFDIGAIAANPTMVHKGVATQLLTEAVTQIQSLDAKYLFSFVVSSPITNFPSMLFHEKHGFERVAITSYKNLFELENYQSILYAKKI